MEHREALPQESTLRTCQACGRSDAMSEDLNHPNQLPPSYVYAVGRIDARLPSVAVEKEFAQATGRAETVSFTDGHALRAMLSEPQNRFLVKQLCYVFTIQGLDAYIVRPRDSEDFNILIDTIGDTTTSPDLHVLIGMLGPLAPPSYCNGLVLPVVAFDQIYSFDAGSLVRSLPKPDSIEETLFRSAAEELFERVIQIADNAGASDAHRALNYLAVRYPDIYAKAARAHSTGAILAAIETRPSRLSGARTIIDVVFSFNNRGEDISEKVFVRVDVTEEFPFLVTKLSPYYDR